MFKRIEPITCVRPVCKYLDDNISLVDRRFWRSAFYKDRALCENSQYIDYICREIERGICTLIVKRDLSLDNDDDVRALLFIGII